MCVPAVPFELISHRRMLHGSHLQFPDSFITEMHEQGIMVCPVILFESGVSYERSEILAWMEQYG